MDTNSRSEVVELETKASDLVFPFFTQDSAFRKVVQTTMVRDRQHGPVIELNRIQVRFPLAVHVKSLCNKNIPVDGSLNPRVLSSETQGQIKGRTVNWGGRRNDGGGGGGGEKWGEGFLRPAIRPRVCEDQ